jgi:hypothetical protein
LELVHPGRRDAFELAAQVVAEQSGRSSLERRQPFDRARASGSNPSRSSVVVVMKSNGSAATNE